MVGSYDWSELGPRHANCSVIESAQQSKERRVTATVGQLVYCTSSCRGEED